MLVGVPREIKNHEYRVGMTPPGIRELGTPGGFPSFARAREAFERRYLMDVLQESKGVVTHAAGLAGMSRQSLHAKIRSYDIDPERFRR